jgi:pilus assembly protein CpaC
LDYTHSVTVQGTTVPGIATRRVNTEIELESGQSFVIAGLIDNQTTEILSKIPGIGSIPILGKLFQSKTMNRSNNELLVIVTPEIVRAIPAGQPLPDLNVPVSFMPANTKGEIGQPGLDKTGPVPEAPPVKPIPVEQMLQLQKQGDPPPFAPGVVAPAPPTPPQAAPAPPAPSQAAPPPSAGGSGGTGK